MARLQWHRSFKDHYYFLYEAAFELLATERHDAILVTGEPWLLFKHAARLSEAFGIPWIADFRDGWSTNITSEAGNLVRRILFPQRIETEAVASAQFITAAAEAIQEELHALHQKDVVVVSNGIDLDQYAWDETTELRKPFTITYTGHLYPGHPVGTFVDGFQQFLKDRPDAEIHVRFVGIGLRETPHLSMLQELAHQAPEHCSIVPPVDHETALRMQRESALLLKFNLADQSKGFYGSKLYEYAASRRPILTLPRQRDEGTKRFLDAKDPQTMAYSPEAVASVLAKHYDAFKCGAPVQTTVAQEDLYPISVQSSTKALAEALNQHVPVPIES